MTGYNLILKIKRLEKECAEFGFTMCHPRNNFYRDQYGDVVSLKPMDKNSLPVYSRDAELFTGTLEELEIWLRGVEWARQYDMLLKVSDEKKRERKEQDVRNKQLISILKDEPIYTVDKK